MARISEEKLVGHLLELLRRTATSIPDDVKKAIGDAADSEESKVAQSTLRLLLENVKQAEECSTPVCQDTGSIIFYVEYYPGEWKQRELIEVIRKAAEKATAKAYLRPNAVDSITGRNSGDNCGIGAPYIHFEEHDWPGLNFRLLLKGGGSENVSTQYKLPDSRLKAGRDMDGVRKCVIDAVFNAQGKGCAPGIIGVGIGGPDRGASMLLAKEQLFRRLDDVNMNKPLAELEKQLYTELNSLGVGPMGFGGKTTVLGVKVGIQHRHPASFFISIAYLCWAARRGVMSVDKKGGAHFD